MSEILGPAVAAHQAGRVDEAEACYRRILAREPRCAEAHFLLGVVHLQRNRPQDALESLRQAIAIDPKDARFHNNLGKALMGLARGQYTFLGHLKWTPIIALGYAARIGTHFLANG